MRMKQISSQTLNQMKIFMIDKTKLNSQTSEIRVKKNRSGIFTSVLDLVTVEAPLQIEIDGAPSTITMRTPGDDKALALGFLFTEGLIEEYNAIADIVQKDENTVNVVSEFGYKIKPSSLDRNFYATSSCGMCGKSSIESIIVKSKYLPPKKDIKIKETTLYQLQDKLLSVQSSFEATGGLHACALFKPDGRYLFHSEDVGRHNALDKLIGHALMAGRLPLDEHILLLSGRASFELIQKAAIAGIPIIASVGAPSSLAVSLADANKQTLIGFLKKNGFNLYTGNAGLT